jgi:hypothetical protein
MNVLFSRLERTPPSSFETGGARNLEAGAIGLDCSFRVNLALTQSAGGHGYFDVSEGFAGLLLQRFGVNFQVRV